MCTLTRQKFLARTFGATVGSALTSTRNSSLLAKPAPEAVPLPSVAVVRGIPTDSIAALLKTAFDGLGGLSRFIRPGQTVAIKPNATWAYPPGTASSTDPELLRVLILMVRAAGAGKIILMDHCTLEPGAAECLRISGLGPVMDALDVEMVFADRFLSSKNLFTKIEIPQGKAFTKVGALKAAVEADVRINLAVAKSHLVTKLTMCLKHMMGFLELPNVLHSQLEQGIADINMPSPIQAQLHILEAIRVRLPVGASRQAGGPETEITHPDKIKRFNHIIAGTDPVLIDSYGCINYFGIRPRELTHLWRAFESGAGDWDVDQAIINSRLREYAPLPTDTPLPKNIGAGAPVSDSVVHGVLSLIAFLNGALIPAAAILAGIGLAVGRRLRQRNPKDQNGKADE
jgi:uncharacterized protein (DUF362 family)